jgi:carbamoyl-phosphate synthase large subunit
MNVLFTCAGRRNYLLEYFKEAMGGSGTVIAADMSRTAPAMALADVAHVVPDVYAEDYVDRILKICQEEEVDLLISLNDLELPVLSPHRPSFEKAGVRLLISEQKVIDICFDKYRTVQFCQDLKMGTPRTYLDLDEARKALESGELSFPVVVKPRWGSASIGLEFPSDMEELELAYRLVTLRVERSILSEASKEDMERSVLIQERIDGIEYGLDILNDFSGRCVQVYVKEKLAMRAGETDKSVLRNHPKLEELGFRVGEALGHIGNVDCDMFEKDGKYYLLELNPRFGGGYPFSQMSGANYPAAILAWLENRKFDFSTFSRTYDQAFAKCDTLIRV